VAPGGGALSAAPKVVVFEELRRSHRPLVRLYLARGYAVYYWRLSIAAGDRSLLPEEASGRVRRLRFDPPLYVGHNEAADLAFGVVDTAYAGWRRSGPVRQTAARYADDAIHLAFQKLVLERLTAFFATDLLARRAKETLGGAPVLVAADAKSAHEDGVTRRRLRGQPGVTTEPACRFPWWQRLAGRAQAMAAGAATAALVVYRVVVAAAKRVLRPAPAGGPPEPFAVGVLLVNPLRQLVNEVRGIDFLADGALVRREHMLFVSPRRLTAEERVKFRERDLRVWGVDEGPDTKTVARMAVRALRLLAHVGRCPSWLLAAAWFLLEDFETWTAFAARYRLEVLVTHADHGYRHVGRNLVLRRGGTRVWYYIDSWNYNNLFPAPAGVPYRSWLWGFLLYDVIVSWNEEIVRYFRRHHQRVGRYLTVGCLWAEHVRLLREGALPSAMRDRLDGHRAAGLKIVSVFPAWYARESVITPEDGLAFLQDVERLLKDFPDIVVIVKEKQPRWFFVRHPSRKVREAFGGEAGAKIYRFYDRMEGLARCELPGHAVAASELIVASDLVISFPFTATSYEALASGVKALYHDPSGRQRGAFYDRIPGLVTHEYGELAARVQELLYATSPRAYARYLDTHVAGALEPALDGRALTRLRYLLAEATSASSARPLTTTPA